MVMRGRRGEKPEKGRGREGRSGERVVCGSGELGAVYGARAESSRVEWSEVEWRWGCAGKCAKVHFSRKPDRPDRYRRAACPRCPESRARIRSYSIPSRRYTPFPIRSTLDIRACVNVDSERISRLNLDEIAILAIPSPILLA